MAGNKEDYAIGLAVACQRLGIPYQSGHKLVLTGLLRGEKRGGRWYVTTASVERYQRERERETAGAGAR